MTEEDRKSLISWMNTYKADSKTVEKIRQKSEFEQEKKQHEKQLLMDHAEDDVRVVRAVLAEMVN